MGSLRVCRYREGNYAVAWYLSIAAVVWISFLWLIDAFDKSLNSNSHKRLVLVLTGIPMCMIFVASLLAVGRAVIPGCVRLVTWTILAVMNSCFDHCKTT
jgi:hypothetical protein